ncbi:MAG: aldo/keto reductase [Motiliproteus sp.]
MANCKLGPFDVSAIGLGCMNLSAGYGPADDEDSEQLLLATLEEGGTRLFDTAAIYGAGHSEKLLGRVLHNRRQQFVLASKGGLSKDTAGNSNVCGRPEALKLQCEQSLRRLQTEVIDLYYLHRLDPQVPVEESVGAMGELVREGKIQALGLSEVCRDTLLRGHREYPISAVQSEYSLWSRTPERAMLSTCAELDITFVPFAPLGRGFLAGSAQPVDQLCEDDIRCSMARPRFETANFKRNSELLVPLRRIANRNGCNLAQLALAWLLSRGRKTEGVLSAGGRDASTDERCRIIPIPGTRSIEHMRQNLAAEAICLSPEDLAELDQLVNDDTVAGKRYNEALMASADSERD